ncbi:MAG: ATP-dependent Clp protease ATP-binding subunit [Clostridia bacterium]|nr:ATP-dependent Clp protease ATP-binding subunit [Clostridia bacterium]
MKYKFQGFSEKANLAINSCIEEAIKLGHTWIGSEHILLGILAEGTSAAALLLEEKNVDYDSVLKQIKEKLGTGNSSVKLDPNDFTPRAKHTLQLAIAEKNLLHTSYIGTEHLLLALLEDEDSYAYAIIVQLGTDPDDIREALMKDIGAENEGSEGSTGKRRGKGSTRTLEQFGRDLTALARQGKIDPVIGREKEIERVTQILSRRTKNNPCLIGEPGVGKTAVAEGLALRIAEGEVPELLKDKRIFSLDLTGMIAGTKYRGDFEERIKNAIDEVKNSSDIILFIDELHTIVGAGSSEGSTDAANILKPCLARGDFQVIGATTLNEYRKYIEKDSALERRFQPVTVGEPSEEESVEILKGLRDKYEAHHKVKITDEAIEAAVKLSSRYINDRYLPDKAIDLVDEAASRVRLNAYTEPDDLKTIENEIKEQEAEMESAVNMQEFERCAKIRDKIKSLKEQKDKIKAEWKESSRKVSGEVTSEDIAKIVSMWTGVPVVQLTEEESQRLLKLEDTLHERVIGQSEAVESVSRAIRRGRVGLKDPKRPIGSFIFLGPTGVGKTELTKALAQTMFGTEDAMIRLDMSEYMEKHTVAKLIGSPPGYVGFDEGGQLTEKVRRKPYSVILFDEIEKAHPDVFNMLLQILDDGRLTDSQGRTVDFKNTVIVMTSNIGASLITNKTGKRLGFANSDEDSDNKDIKDIVLKELKKVFKPEFLNRVDDVIVFSKLTHDEIKDIAGNMLKTLAQRLKGMDIEVEFSDSVKDKLADEGFDDVYGARPLRRTIQTKIEDAISEKILDGTIKKGSKVKCDLKDGEYVFE